MHTTCYTRRSARGTGRGALFMRPSGPKSNWGSRHGMAIDDSATRELVLGFYREELRRRYQLINVRRFEEFEDIPDRQIANLRDFFLEQIYPELREREKLDAAFDQLGDMLRSPKRMSPLLTAALTSLWRMGTKIPAAVGAGKSAIDAYLETRKLEARLIETAQKLKLRPKDAGDRAKMVTLIQAVPEREVLSLVNDILALFRSLTSIEILEVAVAFMEQCEVVMKKRTDLYSEADLEGIHIGLNLIRGGLALFQKMKPNELSLLIAGIERVETDWFQRIRSEAAA